MIIKETIQDVITNKITITERDETAAETKARQDHEAANATAQAEAEAKATAKAELLARLGITADEAKLLLA